eukprot:scaffold88612_cov39-Phaeocystis_antarctica.AAC.1
MRNIKRVSGRLSTCVHRSCVPSSMLAASALVSTKKMALPETDIVSRHHAARRLVCQTAGCSLLFVQFVLQQ